jgi:thioredoxin 1
VNAKLAPAPLRQVDDTAFRAAIAVPGAVVVQFVAHWCQPCAEAGAEVAALAGEMAGGREAPGFVVADIDVAPQAAHLADVTAVPCLVLFRGGARVAVKIGHRKRAEVRAWISDVLKGEA